MTTSNVRCPKCGGDVWDNRATKKNPKQPDFKCKDKTNCDGVIWPPKGAAPVAPASNAKSAHTSGPYIDAIDGPRPIVTPEYGDEPAHHAAIEALRSNKLNALFTLYRTCFSEAVSVAKGLPNATPEAVAAMAATIFIAARERAA